MMKKKIFLWLLGIFLCAGLTACGDKKEESSGSTEKTEQQESVGAEAAEDEKPEEKAEDGKNAESAGDYDFPELKRIEEQSFQVNLNPLGEVTFASYEPDISGDPLADAVFTVEKNGEIVQILPSVSEGNSRANQAFCQVDAVSFPDYNNDGLDDIIIICSYSFASGPDSGQVSSEIRYYTGSESGEFIYEAQMSQDATAGLAEITIETAKNFIGAGKKAPNEKASLEDWQRCYIGYLENSSEMEMQQGYTLIYLDDDDIPELVEIGDCEAAGCRIVNFFNGQVHVTQLNRLYFSYIERGNLLCNSEGNMDYYYDLVFRIEDGELTLIAEGYYGAEDNSNVQYDETGEPIYKYEWNGVEMSKEEYGKELNSVYDMSKARDGYEWDKWYSVDELKAVLEDW